MRIIVIALCLCLIAPAVYAQQPASKMTFKGSSCVCGGKWQTNWGEMTLSQIEDKVTGQYTHDQGKIEGTISGTSFKGRWSEAPTYQDPKDGGLVEWEFSEDCMSFTGRWKYGTTGDWYENGWTGQKTQGAEKLLFH